MTADGLSRQRLIEDLSEWIVAEHRDDDRLVTTAESLLGPFDELREVVQEGGLDLVLGERRLLGERRRGDQEYAEDGER